ncbi:flap endonuclease GEN-like 1 isoform X2 [Nymphaea colorata]|uniref:flap endonuclease GEN-like 1 isoform X2 n=1 Tax=Nymphaea colorata TaxID=210225 RepID=UPI00129EE6C0|nr:flap endonuclease GEN-like 1 isoform X2 [Nymphaea colorata]
MGVGGGGFWELLKPLARYEDFEFLRDKKVAVDLSYWIVQHETALRGSARNPHLRLTFFRTINLFSKFGAFPVFVVDGDPSPLKTKARIDRFFRMSGIDTTDLPKPDGNIVARNGRFVKCVRECVLNSDGHVDACITADGDAFLFGANCVIKDLKPNHKGSFIECYHMSDIEAHLGLRRKHLVAIGLLVGNDYDLKGIQGIGFSNAVRFVQLFHEDDILDRLHEVGKKDPKLIFHGLKNPDTDAADAETSLPKRKPNHCSHCGHPGTRDAHCKGACEYCNVSGVEGCIQKPMGFKCACSSCCEMVRRKNSKKEENWQLKVCRLIGAEENFPNQEIVEMFLASNNGYFSEETGPAISWRKPEAGCLIDFLSYYQNWKPSYIRERLLPLLSTFFLREMASNHSDDLLLFDQYKFDSIHRVKVRNGIQSYVIKWKRAWPEPRQRIDEAPQVRPWHDGQDKNPSGASEVCAQSDDGGSVICQTDPDAMTGESNDQERKSFGTDELTDMLDDAADIAKFVADDGSCYITTDENMELVKSAFPEQVEQFLKEQEVKKAKSGRRKSPTDQGTAQRSITEYFRSTKRLSSSDQIIPIKDAGIASPSQNVDKRTIAPAAELSKSARRRLLFN